MWSVFVLPNKNGQHIIARGRLLGLPLTEPTLLDAERRRGRVLMKEGQVFATHAVGDVRWGQFLRTGIPCFDLCHESMVGRRWCLGSYGQSLIHGE